MAVFSDITENGRAWSLGLLGGFAALLVLGGCVAWHYAVDDGGIDARGRSVTELLRDQTSEIETIQDNITSMKKRLADATAMNADAGEATRQIETNQQEIEVRKQAITSSKAEAKQLETAFEKYRRDYRDRTWRAAAGEKVAVLTLRSGKRYENATISRVTEGGLEIAFDEGRARIAPADLDATWQRRFDWDPIPSVDVGGK